MQTETATATKTVSPYQLLVFVIDAVTVTGRLSAKGHEIMGDACDLAQVAFDLYETDVAAFQDLAPKVIKLATEAHNAR
jgi:hypothetical protein